MQTIELGFQDGVLPDTSYLGTRDATIASGQPNRLFGGSSTCLSVAGSTSQSCVLRWDVSAIPAGSVVTSASITLSAGKGSISTHGIYELKQAWTESQVTWVNRNGAWPWGAPGALSSEDRGPLVGTLSGGLGIHTVPISVSLVQSWVDGQPNHGVIVSAQGSGNLLFASSEHGTLSNRPRLTVVYQPCDPLGCNMTVTVTTGYGPSGAGGSSGG